MFNIKKLFFIFSLILLIAHIQVAQAYFNYSVRDLSSIPEDDPVYAIDYSDQNTERWGYPVYDEDVNCGDRYDNGVVRSWYVKERNKYDFRRSYIYCRDMLEDGTLDSDYDRMDHFYYEGNGTTGDSSIPTSKLPVGVRLRINDSDINIDKVSDVNMLYDSADDIIEDSVGYNSAGYALDRSGDTVTLFCGAGYVMTGLYVRADDGNVGGSNQAEIYGIKISCHRLVLE